MPKQLKLVHLVTILCLLIFAISTHGIALEKDGLLKIHFLDVGQGDAIFIESPNGNQVLIDGGPDNKVLTKLSQVMPFFDKTIDLVLLTHAHADHVAGLVGVLERYDIENIVMTNSLYDSGQFRSWLDGVSNEGAKIAEALAGRKIDLGNGVELIILYPFIPQDESKPKDPNEISVVAMLKYKDFEVLLTGDLEQKQEEEILRNNLNINSDVLKIGHHGSKTSTSGNFLKAISPEVAAISVGLKNRYGHPSPLVIDRLESSDVKYYLTSTKGDIKIISDGSYFKIITQK